MKGTTRETELENLRRRVEEAEEALRAIRGGEVDAVVIESDGGEQVFTLQGAEHPYRALIEAMQQGAVSFSTDGMILYCNRCFADMLHHPHEKIIGTSVTSLMPSDDRGLFEKLLQQGRTRTSQGELRLETAAGQLLPVYVVLAPLALANAIAICMVVTDLTEQKEHQILQDTSRRKDEFLAMLAHELRNPLAPIRNAVALLELPSLPPETLVYSREIIRRQAEHLSRLVDDLLDVSRITLGKVKLQKTAVDLADVIARAIETSRPIIDGRHHHLKLHLPLKNVRLKADPTRLAQVISNLLTNAAKYTEEGGLIELHADQFGPQIIIRIRDTGTGIAPELLPLIFDLFIQGDRSLARSEGGLGIGLTLVRRLLEMHGGTVEAHSDGLGKGSEFVVRLPALAPSAPGRDQESPHVSHDISSACTGHHRILVVEDNFDSADTLAMLLRVMGHDVKTAYSGNEALRNVAQYRPTVVLLDIGLPGITGFEVANKMRELPELQNTVLVAVTGYGQEEDKKRSHEAGFKHHLVKPVDPDLLKVLLESIPTC
ncbi:MAG: ATP-binding protein [Gemmataceae bacterium]